MIPEGNPRACFCCLCLCKYVYIRSQLLLLTIWFAGGCYWRLFTILLLVFVCYVLHHGLFIIVYMFSLLVLFRSVCHYEWLIIYSGHDLVLVDLDVVVLEELLDLGRCSALLCSALLCSALLYYNFLYCMHYYSLLYFTLRLV